MINVTFETRQALHVIIAGARAVGCDSAEQVADLIFPVGNWIAPRPSLGTSTKPLEEFYSGLCILSLIFSLKAIVTYLFELPTMTAC